MMAKGHCEVSVLDYWSCLCRSGHVKFEELVSQDSFLVTGNTNLDSRKEAEIADVDLGVPILQSWYLKTRSSGLKYPKLLDMKF